MLALTVDVEERGSTVVAGTQILLDLFESHAIRGTFFVVGEVAEQYPFLISEIVKRGHEIGFHGYKHFPLLETNEYSLLHELSDWRKRLEDIAQLPVRGYRAPLFSVTHATKWALNVISQAGFQYDASIYPGLRYPYSWIQAPRHPVRMSRTGLILFPVPIISRLMPLAFSGGGYLALLPWCLIKAGIRLNKKSHNPGMVYVHPWQIIPDSTKIGSKSQSTSFRDAILDWFGRDKIDNRLNLLLNEWQGEVFPMWEVISSLNAFQEWEPQ